MSTLNSQSSDLDEQLFDDFAQERAKNKRECEEIKAEIFDSQKGSEERKSMLQIKYISELELPTNALRVLDLPIHQQLRVNNFDLTKEVLPAQRKYKNEKTSTEGLGEYTRIACDLSLWSLRKEPKKH